MAAKVRVGEARLRTGHVPSTGSVAVAAVLVALSAVAGCGHGGTGAAGRPAHGAATSPAAGPDWRITPEQNDRLAQAENTLIGRCMTAHGFAFVVLPPPARSTAPDLGYGLTDVRWAARHGYGIGDHARDGAGPAARANPNTAIFNGLSPARQAAYSTALDGSGAATVTADVPGVGRISARSDGCRAAARRTLYGDLGQWGRVHTLATNTEALVHPRVLADPRYADTLAAWRGCMAGLGQHVAGPTAAVAKAADGYRAAAPDAARAAEVRIATDDATCERRVGMDTTVSALREHYLQEVTAEYRADLATYHRLAVAALGRLPAITGNRP